jgi:biofilm PGA synthesis N-glycosyltransferase PgaC
MAVFLSILLGILLIYVILILILARGVHRLSPAGPPSPDPHLRVSLIVPFRNEREHLPALIHDLRAQSYPAELTEILFVDDHSEDGSGEVLKELIGNLPQFHLIGLQPGITGKKRALGLGIEHASGEWIIQTDADCRLGDRFIGCHVSRRQETGADMVAGMVITGEAGKSLLEGLEILDQLSLTGAGAGSFYLGRPLLCSGANLSFSPGLYRDTRIFDPDIQTASGDDMFLMIGARKLGRKLDYLKSEDAMVRTRPATSLRNLINQRIRWGAKAAYYHQADIQGVVLLTVFANLTILVMPWLLLLFPQAWTWVVAGLSAKVGADFLLLWITAGYAGQRRQLRFFLPVVLVYYPFQAVILLGSLFKRGNWKGR